MTKPPVQDGATAVDLKSKFGEDADIYAEVRAEAAATAGRYRAASKWKQVAEDIEADSDNE